MSGVTLDTMHDTINALPHDNPSRIQAWANATDELRKDTYFDAYVKSYDKIEKARKGKKMTQREITQAENLAKAEVVKTIYNLKSHNGLTNPIHDDDEWGPNRTTHNPVLSPKQVAAAESMKAKSDARQPQRESSDTGLDLADLPSGYYAVPGGSTRLKVRVAHGKPGTKWDGWTFVSDGAEYGQRKNYGKQAPDGTYRGEIQDQLRAIIADPYAAQIAYGRLWEVCGNCGKKLEDPDSIEAGIGPICAAKWAA